MPANSPHPDYNANAAKWQRARDVIEGEDAIKLAGVRYLPKLDSQTANDYEGYKSRACFFNATSRTADGFLGLLFRRDPEVKLPDRSGGIGSALSDFIDDVDLMGTSLFTFCKGVVGEVLAVGRCGTLVDWQGAAGTSHQGENRVYAVRYTAEDILNWQSRRINGRNVVTLVCLREVVERPDAKDPFLVNHIETVRVLRLQELKGLYNESEWIYVVEIWERMPDDGKVVWVMVDQRVPLRLGKPLPLIPFVFHGPRNSLPDVDKMPLADIIYVNLDHYRLDADYKHGLHYTALPTAWVSGFEKDSNLRIGSSTAWVSETPGAAAGFLEFKGLGLSTFETAQGKDERNMAVLGSRMLEDTKRVGETAQAIELRQAGENSILMTLALSISDSLTHVLRWVYWWNSTESLPEDISEELVLLKINTDFTAKGLTSLEITAIVGAWQAGAISQPTMFDLFRKGEVLPVGRTDAEEKSLIGELPLLKNQIGREIQTGVFPNAGNPPVLKTSPAATNP